MVDEFTTTCAITKVVSLNHAHGEVYSMQLYVIQFVSDLRQCRWFSPDIPVSSKNKTDLHDITEIWLKVALNTIDIVPILYIALEVRRMS